MVEAAVDREMVHALVARVALAVPIVSVTLLLQLLRQVLRALPQAQILGLERGVLAHRGRVLVLNLFSLLAAASL